MRLVAAAQIFENIFHPTKMRRVPGCQYIGKPNHLIASITRRLCMLCQ